MRASGRPPCFARSQELLIGWPLAISQSRGKRLRGRPPVRRPSGSPPPLRPRLSPLPLPARRLRAPSPPGPAPRAAAETAQRGRRDPHGVSQDELHGKARRGHQRRVDGEAQQLACAARRHEPPHHELPGHRGLQGGRREVPDGVRHRAQRGPGHPGRAHQDPRDDPEGADSGGHRPDQQPAPRAAGHQPLPVLPPAATAPDRADPPAGDGGGAGVRADAAGGAGGGEQGVPDGDGAHAGAAGLRQPRGLALRGPSEHDAAAEGVERGQPGRPGL